MRLIPYGKMSKRKQRAMDARKRETWGQVNPMTRKIESTKVYQRKKTRRSTNDMDGGFSFVDLREAPMNSVSQYS